LFIILLYYYGCDLLRYSTISNTWYSYDNYSFSQPTFPPSPYFPGGRAGSVFVTTDPTNLCIFAGFTSTGNYLSDTFCTNITVPHTPEPIPIPPPTFSPEPTPQSTPSPTPNATNTMCVGAGLNGYITDCSCKSLPPFPAECVSGIWTKLFEML